jgi:hypothetical protein
MTWSIMVDIDKDKAEAGTIAATWTDPNPALGVFSYSKRIETTLAALDNFNAELIMERNAWQAKRQNNLDKAAVALGRLNSADPQAA